MALETAIHATVAELLRTRARRANGCMSGYSRDVRNSKELFGTPVGWCRAGEYRAEAELLATVRADDAACGYLHALLPECHSRVCL